MKKIGKILNLIFIDGLAGMALGLFATLIIGTIIEQIGQLIGGTVGSIVVAAAAVAKSLTGAGIGIGIACKYKKPPLVAVSAAVAGMVGAFATKLLAGTVVAGSVVTYAGPGEPLGAFVAAMVAIGFGCLVAGKTKLDIILTPLVMIVTGGAAGLLVGPPISSLMTFIGQLININVDKFPFFGGIVVSALMGMCLTLPISSAAIGISLGLDGIAAGAAVAGCCAHMVGFAVASYRENKLGGLIAQGVGTSMLQMPNIVKHPLISIPPILSSMILGPVATCVFKMTSNAVGSGMGTAGLVGPIMTYSTMTSASTSSVMAIIIIVIMCFVAPAVLSLLFSEVMRKLKWIKAGEMKLIVDK